MPFVDTKLLRAALALAEELSFTRAARRLNLGQSAFSKQISALEELLGHQLFERNTRSVRVTQAGEAFIKECRLSLLHQERAVQLSGEADRRSVNTLRIGKCPYTEPLLLTLLLSTKLPSAQDPEIHLTSSYTMELRNQLLAGALDIAFLSGLPPIPEITWTLVSTHPLWVAMPNGHALSRKSEVDASDLSEYSCILFERRVHPLVYDKLQELCRPAAKAHTITHHVLTAEEALSLLVRNLGVAVLTESDAWRISHNSVTARPLNVPTLEVRTYLASRSNDDHPTVSRFTRSFMTRLEDFRRSARAA